MFRVIQLQCPNFDVAIVYHMAGKMMQRKIQSPRNVAMNEAKDCIEGQSTECIKKQAASEAVEALCRWKGWKKDPPLATKFEGGLHLDDVKVARR